MDKQQLSNLLHIQNASRENRLVVFVGAGVSRNSGIPTWNDLIKTMKSELPDKLANDMDALKVAQLYKDARGHKEYMDKVKEVLLYNKAVPNPLHKRILALKPCHMVTTNYDDLIEQELINEFIQYAVVREDKDIPQMVHPNALVKMHGDYATDNIVLTETDYYNYSNNFPLIRAFVLSLFASKLVLFVGFSFADLNLKMILNELKGILSENIQRAYLLSCEEPDSITKQYFEKKGINVLYFSEKDIDSINGSDYPENSLSGIGLLTDKILFAIKNYSPISKNDLVSYIYDRIISYNKELLSFGDGLRYFFPNNKSMLWNTHSSGLQTHLPYFEDIAKQLQSNQQKRKFLITHPNIDLRSLLKIACYNYLYEIDGIKILDDKFCKNVDNYVLPTTMCFLHKFDQVKTCERLKVLRAQSIQYTIEDLEYPFTLYLLGDYWEAYKQYVKLIPLYWNRQKYILYFICRYNIWSIRYGVEYQQMQDGSFNSDKELQLAYAFELEDILNKLPIDLEIKKMFQDLISYRFVGSHVVETYKLKEKIFQQRKSAEKGGCSINSNILVLMALYQRESIFSWANYIICDNNEHFKSVCNNTALGILNSFATPTSKMFGGKLCSTKIESLDSFMLEMLIFDVEHEQLISIFKGYDIMNLVFDTSGVEYINLCLNGLGIDCQYLYKSDLFFYNPLCNLFRIISKSHINEVDTEALYKALLKYWRFELQIGNETINNLIRQYSPSSDFADKLISQMLYNSHNTEYYRESIRQLATILKKNKLVFSDIRMDTLKQNHEDKVLILLYPICSESLKDTILDYCLENIEDFWYYIYFVFHNAIQIPTISRFKELFEKDKNSINENYCYILAKIRKDSIFANLHGIIDEFAISNDCMQFFLSPDEYMSPEKVEVDWILKFNQEKRERFFKNEVYRNKLKEYITGNWLSDSNRQYLISLL